MQWIFLRSAGFLIYKMGKYMIELRKQSTEIFKLTLGPLSVYVV